MRRQNDLCIRCCFAFCTCFCRQLARSMFQNRQERIQIYTQYTESSTKKNRKICLGISIAVVFLIGLVIGMDAYEQINSIDDLKPQFYRCIDGCSEYSFNLFGKCCTTDLDDTSCQTIDYCKSQAKRPYHSLQIIGFTLALIMTIISIIIVACCGAFSKSNPELHQLQTKKNSLLQSQKLSFQAQEKGPMTNKIKKGLNFCWDVDPSEDEALLNNQILQCLICQKKLLGKRIIKQKCCGAYNHKKCYKQWISSNQTCISCKAVILF